MGCKYFSILVKLYESHKFQLDAVPTENGFDSWIMDKDEGFENAMEILSYIPNYNPVVFHASLKDLNEVWVIPNESYRMTVIVQDMIYRIL